MPSRTQSDASEPLVWLLMGNRAGDNSQVQGLGEALGWPLVEKHFVYSRHEKLVNLPFGAHLLGVVKERSSALEPPWPDLVISAGRKNEPIARYIRARAAKDLGKRQNAAPGKQVRLIHVGRPWAKPSTWDLVITTPQYRLPRDPNILHNETPLHRVTRARLDEAARAWQARAAELPRPHIAVLAGGNSGPYPFNRASGERLARELNSSSPSSEAHCSSRRARVPSTSLRRRSSTALPRRRSSTAGRRAIPTIRSSPSWASPIGWS